MTTQETAREKFREMLYKLSDAQFFRGHLRNEWLDENLPYWEYMMRLDVIHEEFARRALQEELSQLKDGQTIEKRLVKEKPVKCHYGISYQESPEAVSSTYFYRTEQERDNAVAEFRRTGKLRIMSWDGVETKDVEAIAVITRHAIYEKRGKQLLDKNGPVKDKPIVTLTTSDGQSVAIQGITDLESGIRYFRD